MMSPQDIILLVSFCLCSAAQETPKLPDAHESNRKAYDEIYADHSDEFSALPNAFMIRMITGRTPGHALDAGMGQGLEEFHIDTARVRPLGGGLHNNELFQLLKDYRMLVYEDLEDRQDWGRLYGSCQSPGARPRAKERGVASGLLVGRKELRTS